MSSFRDPSDQLIAYGADIRTRLHRFRATARPLPPSQNSWRICSTSYYNRPFVARPKNYSSRRKNSAHFTPSRVSIAVYIQVEGIFSLQSRFVEVHKNPRKFLKNRGDHVFQRDD